MKSLIQKTSFGVKLKEITGLKGIPKCKVSADKTKNSFHGKSLDSQQSTSMNVLITKINISTALKHKYYLEGKDADECTNIINSGNREDKSTAFEILALKRPCYGWQKAFLTSLICAQADLSSRNSGKR